MPSIVDPDPDSKIDAHQFVIVGDWLAIDIGKHNCGTGRDGHYGAHEPGCGLEPVLPLNELDAALTADARLQRVEALHAAHVRRCLDCRQQIQCEFDDIRRALMGDA